MVFALRKTVFPKSPSGKSRCSVISIVGCRFSEGWAGVYTNLGVTTPAFLRVKSIQREVTHRSTAVSGSLSMKRLRERNERRRLARKAALDLAFVFLLIELAYLVRYCLHYSFRRRPRGLLRLGTRCLSDTPSVPQCGFIDSTTLIVCFLRNVLAHWFSARCCSVGHQW